jgi:hypothetical protein
VPNLWTIRTAGLDFSATRLKAALTAYDILNDDDGDVRDVGSYITSTIRSSIGESVSGETCVPLVASQQLVAYLARQYPASSELCTEALGRMITSGFRNGNISPSARERFASSTAENTALFVVEKQNLFIDRYREVVVWSQVLKQLSTKAITRSTATPFSDWTREGLALLTEQAENEIDGALGWTSKSEVFVFGMQVILAADVLMNWRNRTRKAPMEGKQIRTMLVSLLKAGRQSELHEEWLLRIENILIEDARRRVMRFGAMMTGIAGRLQ